MVSKLILGTVQFGLEYGINNSSGKPTTKEVFSILDAAFKNDILFLDTAEGYGNSQDIIGDYHRQSANRFNVITKYASGRKDLSENWVKRISEDLEILNCNSLYAYMFHSYKDFEAYYQTKKSEIVELKKKGLIKKFGVSIYTNEEFEACLNFDTIDLIQLPFNLLDNNYQRASLLKLAKEMGIEIHTRSVFLQGLFFKNLNTLPEKLIKLKPYLSEIRTMSEKNSLLLNDICLNYVVQQNNIDNVLIGVDTLEQLQQNIFSLQNKVDGSVMSQLDDINVVETELLNPSNWNK